MIFLANFFGQTFWPNIDQHFATFEKVHCKSLCNIVTHVTFVKQVLVKVQKSTLLLQLLEFSKLCFEKVKHLSNI